MIGPPGASAEAGALTARSRRSSPSPRRDSLRPSPTYHHRRPRSSPPRPRAPPTRGCRDASSPAASGAARLTRRSAWMPRAKRRPGRRSGPESREEARRPPPGETATTPGTVELSSRPPPAGGPRLLWERSNGNGRRPAVTPRRAGLHSNGEVTATFRTAPVLAFLASWPLSAQRPRAPSGPSRSCRHATSPRSGFFRNGPDWCATCIHP